MKISWNWLGDYVDLDGLDVEAVADRLTMTGLELEGIERLGEQFAPIVVGHILAIDPHPQADKLTVCRVSTGGEPVQIVCGAKNMAVGDKVPVIPAGNRLPDGTKIKRGSIRGQVSNGMMCSAKELGLGEDHFGLMILDAQAPLGAPFAEVAGLTDVVLDFAITPNRGDCLSHLGIAREVAALFGRDRRHPGALGGADPVATGAAGAAADHVRVTIEDVDGCPRYAAAVVKDVVVGPSPVWLARRLEAVGQRSVNNLVDVTNYVMLETGQPLHAFDLDDLPKDAEGRAHIVVRRAAEGETMVAIDHVERRLSSEDCVITDGRVPVAVAGVMGGLESEVSAATRHVLIECAHFNPRRIRRSAKRLGLGTESSYRFERTVDIDGIDRAIRRAVELLQATQPEGREGAPRVAVGTVDAYARRYPKRTLHLRAQRCQDLLGVSITRDAMVALLASIDLTVLAGQGEDIVVEPPNFRPDLEREVDLIEEVGRLYGFDRLEATLPSGALGYVHRPRTDEGAHPATIVPDAVLYRIDRLRDLLAHGGLNESVNYAFTARERIAAMGFADDDERARPVAVHNPLSEDWRVMRTTLLPGLLINARHNLGHQQRSIALFELGPVFFQDEGSETGVREEVRLAVLLTGERPVRMVSEARPYDVFDLKGLLEAVMTELGSVLAPLNHEGRVAQLHPGLGAEWTAMGAVQGFFGQLHPRLAEAFDISEPVYVAELALGRELLEASRVHPFEPIARYPSAARDLALVVDEHRAYGDVERAVRGFKNGLVEAVELSSVYSGDPIPTGKKSIALSIRYRSPTGSLTDKKIDAVHQRLAQHICEAIDAEPR